mgnify:CR=1 FL=1
MGLGRDSLESVETMWLQIFEFIQRILNDKLMCIRIYFGVFHLRSTMINPAMTAMNAIINKPRNVGISDDVG